MKVRTGNSPMPPLARPQSQLANSQPNLISVNESIDDAGAPVHAIFVNLFRLWMAFSVETIKNFDSIRQCGSSRRYDSRLQAVTYSAFINAHVTREILKPTYDRHMTILKCGTDRSYDFCPSLFFEKQEIKHRITVVYNVVQIILWHDHSTSDLSLFHFLNKWGLFIAG